jgi:hypothetical protein
MYESPGWSWLWSALWRWQRSLRLWPGPCSPTLRILPVVQIAQGCLLSSRCSVETGLLPVSESHSDLIETLFP